MGDNGRQGKTRQDLGKADTPSSTGTHVGRQWETRGDKRTHHPTQAHLWGDNGKQGETKGDKGGEDLGKADTPSNTKADTVRKH